MLNLLKLSNRPVQQHIAAAVCANELGDGGALEPVSASASMRDATDARLEVLNAAVQAIAAVLTTEQASRAAQGLVLAVERMNIDARSDQAVSVDLARLLGALGSGYWELASSSEAKRRPLLPTGRAPKTHVNRLPHRVRLRGLDVLESSFGEWLEAGGDRRRSVRVNG